MTRTDQKPTLAVLLSAAAFVFAASAAFMSPPATAGAGPAIQPPPTVKEPAPPPIDMNASWPCVQHKVEKLSVAQIWDGPSIEEVKGWFRDEQVASLVEVLISRRIPVEEAEKAIEAFSKSLSEEKKDERLTLLFAGLFDRSSTQRRGIMSGIERYQKSQQERSRELERQSNAIVKLHDEAKTDESAKAKVKEAEEKFDWAQRIFQERQANIPLACELPILIEERLFILTRAIRNNMTS